MANNGLLSDEELLGTNQPSKDFMSDEELIGNHKQPSENNTGYTALIGKTIGSGLERWNNAQKIASSNQSFPSKVYQQGTNVVGGLINDPIKNVISSIPGSEAVGGAIGTIANAITPDWHKEGTAVLMGPVTRAYENASPETQNNIKSTGELAQAASNFLIPGAKNIALEATAPIAKTAAQTVMDLKRGTYAPMKAAPELIDGIPIKEAAKVVDADAARSMGTDLWNHASNTGGILNEKFSNNFANDISNLTSRIANEPGSDAWSKTFKLNQGPIADLQSSLNNLRGQPLGLSTAMAVDKKLGDVIHDSILPNGKLSAQGEEWSRIQNTLRDAIEKAPPEQFVGGRQGFDATVDARKLWRNQANLQDIERIIKKATDSQNTATVAQNAFKNLAASKKMQYYTPEQQFLINKGASGSMKAEALRALGSRLNVIAAAHAAGPAAGVAQWGISNVARNLAGKVQVSPVSQLRDLLAEDSLRISEKWKKSMAENPSRYKNMQYLPPDVFGGPNIPPNMKAP